MCVTVAVIVLLIVTLTPTLLGTNFFYQCGSLLAWAPMQSIPYPIHLCKQPLVTLPGLSACHYQSPCPGPAHCSSQMLRHLRSNLASFLSVRCVLWSSQPSVMTRQPPHLALGTQCMRNPSSFFHTLSFGRVGDPLLTLRPLTSVLVPAGWATFYPGHWSSRHRGTWNGEPARMGRLHPDQCLEGSGLLETASEMSQNHCAR